MEQRDMEQVAAIAFELVSKTREQMEAHPGAVVTDVAFVTSFEIPLDESTSHLGVIVQGTDGRPWAVKGLLAAGMVELTKLEDEHR